MLNGFSQSKKTNKTKSKLCVTHTRIFYLLASEIYTIVSRLFFLSLLHNLFFIRNVSGMASSRNVTNACRNSVFPFNMNELKKIH